MLAHFKWLSTKRPPSSRDRQLDHAVGDGVTIRAKERYVEGFPVIPMVALKPLPAAAPGAPHRPLDQAERFAEGRRATRRAGPNAAGLEHVPANFEMTTETSEQRPLALTSDLFHHSPPVSWNRMPSQSQRERQREPGTSRRRKTPAHHRTRSIIARFYPAVPFRQTEARSGRRTRAWV